MTTKNTELFEIFASFLENLFSSDKFVCTVYQDGLEFKLKNGHNQLEEVKKRLKNKNLEFAEIDKKDNVYVYISRTEYEKPAANGIEFSTTTPVFEVSIGYNFETIKFVVYQHKVSLNSIYYAQSAGDMFNFFEKIHSLFEEKMAQCIKNVFLTFNELV